MGAREYGWKTTSCELDACICENFKGITYALHPDATLKPKYYAC